MDVIINRYGNFYTLTINPDNKNYTCLKSDILSVLTGEVVQTRMDYSNSRYGKRIYESVPILLYTPKVNKLSTGNVEEFFQYFNGMQFKVEAFLKKQGISYTINDITAKSYENRYSINNTRLKQCFDALRDQQDIAVKAIMDNNCGQIICPTGFGKSYIISWLCQIFPKSKIIVTTHISSVLQQLYSAISANNFDVGIISATIKKNKDARIICCGSKSIHHADSDADIVLADEVHELGTVASYNAFTVFNHARMYGFTASRKRNDGGECIVDSLFGPVLTEIEYQQAVVNGNVVQLEVRFVDVNMPDPYPYTGNDTAKEKKCIWANKYRNKIIADIANRHKHEQVLITCKTIEHAFHLKEVLPDYTVIYGGGTTFEKLKKLGVIPKDTKKLSADDQIEIKDKFSRGELKHVISTSVWNRGVDFKPLQVVIRTDASSSIVQDKQIPGRVSRVYDGKAVGIIYDFNDLFNETFARRSRTRQRHYAKEGWDIKNVKFWYDE